MLRKISLILLFTLIILGCATTPLAQSGHWTKTGELEMFNHYLLAIHETDWTILSFYNNDPDKVDKLIFAFNMPPVTKPPVYLYTSKDGVITPVTNPPWKWVPDTL